MKALLESLLVPEDASWRYFYRRLDDCILFNRPWHYHPELELTITENSIGQRYVGDSIEPYEDGDVTLVGSNLPHTWMSQDRIDRAKPHVAHVFWIRADWLTSLCDHFRELAAIRTMQKDANRGVVFSPAVSKIVRTRVAGAHALTPTLQLTRFIEILSLLADDRDYRVLCAPRVEQLQSGPAGRPRIDCTLEYIHKNYQREIAVPELAELVALSVSGLHRLFKRHTRVTVGEYIAQLRIGKACALLTSTEKPISVIADEVGYANLSHFNRQFLSVKGLTPREFRRSFARNDPHLTRPQPRSLVSAEWREVG
ncbi:helix-turn-helix domain-containing protein [Ramlibacter tataouinensis]|uniref:Transcriptional regulator, AraC family-like protein n=1 Tax=Ramlibacter tataouinensis (strain ATCC BAA-407 / DSM 14655 / LMG 21543 / TTB310) TaxID=365046 RepID=F5XVZ9_RAMTT|nr:AraC family transcriptional regulator [Ramlibacter tataouinensis]AEG94102.1 transcriptional regulator, AraC family-like protein [Ramlibacter tataouinensis TTB310]